MTKDIQDLYTKKYSKDTQIERDLPCSWNVKMSALPKLIYRFDVISSKITVGFFLGRNWQTDSKIYVDMQKVE